jgi:protein TonB
MTETAMRFRDDPWPRLPWLVPAALVLTFLSQVIFLSLLGGPEGPPSIPRPVDVQVIELPVAAPAPSARSAPPERRPSPPPKRATDASPPSAPAASPPRIEAPPAPTPPVSEEPLTPAPPATVTAPPLAPAAPSAAPPAPSPLAAVPPPRGPQDGVGGTDRMSARAIYKPMPEIPEALRRRTVDLVAVARFRVEASGSAQVELIEPTPDPDLNHALLDSLRRWRFFPATQGGRPVASTIEIRIPVSVR